MSMDYQKRELSIAISRLERNGKEATIDAVMMYVAARPLQFPTLDWRDVPELWPEPHLDARTCLQHGTAYFTLDGGCAICDQEAYQDWKATERDALDIGIQ